MPSLRQKTIRPRRLDYDADPVRIFVQIADQPGAVFLDSALGEDGFSILAFDPECVVDDFDQIRTWLRKNRPESAPDIGFPLGAAIGQVDYEGKLAFGLYPGLLVHRRASGEWFDVGGVADQLDWDFEPAKPAAAGAIEFQADRTEAEFIAAVQRAKDWIAAGDIYQVNLSHRFKSAWPRGASAWPFYLALRECSPAPHAGFFNFGDRQILSSSPEEFLKMSGQGIRTRPIKGTRPRLRDPELDEFSRYELITSPKEQAELIMITDLLRNDLGQVCEFGSVQAIKLLEPEAYEHVHHLVSTVIGQLRPEIDHVGAFQACFPGGSITGAPKKRAMEIIAELERSPRGVYTGAIGYFGLNDESQFNIAIRTAVVEESELHFHVGAGIVADSDPEFEYQETLHKAAGMFQAAEFLRTR
ncbi:MAG: para-aminobenzoate synthetase component 1 [Verrucomicrobiales bacterium]|jgi:para-aminobenzoate synthetase component 1